MTLNITILTPTVIYQSGDYRLSDFVTGNPELMPSTKAVGIRYREWTGFLTYTGIGRLGPRSTADFVTEWLRDHGDLSYAEAVEIIRERGSAWLSSARHGTQHTFVLAAFDEHSPVAAVISNFQKWHGASEAVVASELFVTEVRPAKKAEVIVTGVRAAVSRQQRRQLQRVAESHAHEPLRVRAAISQVTRAAARLFPKLISEDSFVQSLDQHGRGRQEATGATRASPRELLYGVDMLEKLRPLLDQQFGKNQWTVAGSASVSSDDRSSTPPPCEVKVSATSPHANYTLRTLKCPPGNWAQPRALNAKGEIVGGGVPHWRGPSYPCLWTQSGELVFLPHFGGLGGMATGIAQTSTIVGASEMPNRHSRACKWLAALELLDLGSSLPSHSGARAVNAAGDIVGWSSIHPTEGGQGYFRPTLWQSNREPLVLTDLGGRWGEAIDINDRGDALIMTHDNRTARALLWQGQDLIDLGLPSATCVSFFPAKLTASGSVLGTTHDAHHHRGAAIRYADDRWSRVPLRPGAHVTCGTDKVLAGAELAGSYELPWVWTPGEPEPSYLPHYPNHYNRPIAVGPAGRIIGAASADYCSHPIVWTPCDPP